MNALLRRFSVVALLFVVAVGCQTTPPSEAEKEELVDESAAAVQRMEAADPALRDVLHRAHGYVVFPKVGKGGLIVGGAYGRGNVYEQGKMIGNADLTQATIGAQIGGQTFAEVIAFENAAALDRFKNNQLAFSANASAVAVKKGAAASAKYENGVIVFTHPNAGAMLEASVGGQKFTYVPVTSGTATTRPSARAEAEKI